MKIDKYYMKKIGGIQMGNIDKEIKEYLDFTDKIVFILLRKKMLKMYHIGRIRTINSIM